MLYTKTLANWETAAEEWKNEVSGKEECQFSPVVCNFSIWTLSPRAPAWAPKVLPNEEQRQGCELQHSKSPWQGMQGPVH